MQSYKDAVYLLPDSKSHDSQLFDAGKSSLELSVLIMFSGHILLDSLDSICIKIPLCQHIYLLLYRFKT